MKGLSLTEPWASLVITGEKTIETRSWSTNYRGTLAVQAAKGFPAWAKEKVGFGFFKRLENYGFYTPADFTLGAIIGLVDVVDCISTNRTDRIPPTDSPEFSFGDYSPNRYMWILTNPRRLETPIIKSGALGLWTITDELIEQIIKES